ncbi:MAG: hypothetical protein JO086_09365 [Acidimicrobiia bacterium]|nr:hypothetical protein [Acidimicrobiia bacterium]
MSTVLADNTLFLGSNLLAWLLLALGGAMAVGNVLALLRPPENTKKGDLARAPVGRSVLFIGVGALAAIWAIASLTR